MSLTNRHLVSKDVELDVGLWKRVSGWFLSEYSQECCDPWTYTQVIDGYSGRKKARYVRALMTNNYKPIDTRVKMMLKQDKFPLDKIEAKAPRAIQFRNEHYNLAIMKYIKPIEEWVYDNVRYGCVSDTRVICKNLNCYERADLLLEKVKWFRKPKYYLLDHSAFDSCITEYHLRSTHKKYRKLINSREFRFLLTAQIYNKGKTTNGTKYKVVGTRMSGDADTALGNCIVNLDVLTGVLKLSKIQKYDLMVDGDDSVVIVEDHECLELSWFSKLGFETKCEVVNDLDDVEFCQSKICFDGMNHCFVRNPIRMLAHYSVYNKQDNPRLINEWLTGIALCENTMYGQYPIYNAVVRGFMKSDKYLVDRDLDRRLCGLKPSRTLKKVTVEARESLERVWKIPLFMQLIIEEDITTNMHNFTLSNKKSKQNDESMARAWQRYQLCYESSSSSWWSGN